MRVLAAMSGGVDSAVAAARAVEAGHDVVGVHLALSTAPGALRTGSRGCCSREDADDARRAADVLGIPFYVWDFADRFKDDVIDEFVEAYAAGQTPNPCLTCNEKIKFAALAEKAIALGFDALATGHYAQLTDGELRRAVDADKDQSYVLAVLTREQLDRAMFPIGDTPKPEIRAEAARRGLSVANKPDSHDICFIPTGDTRAFLGARIGIRPGAVVDADTGERLADHEGVHGFTIGQRKGLGIEAPAADGRPRYVTDIDPESGTVRVGIRGAPAGVDDPGIACGLDLRTGSRRAGRVHRPGACARRDGTGARDPDRRRRRTRHRDLAGRTPDRRRPRTGCGAVPARRAAR